MSIVRQWLLKNTLSVCHKSCILGGFPKQNLQVAHKKITQLGVKLLGHICPANTLLPVLLVVTD